MTKNSFLESSDNFKFIPVRVAKVLDDYKLVLNIGSLNGVTIGQRFLIYGLSSEEILDPITKEPLGYLELVRGTGSVIYIQDRICIIKSDATQTNFFKPLTEPSTVPFDQPHEGDLAREIS